MLVGLTPPAMAESIIFLILIGVLVDPVLLIGCVIALLMGGMVGVPLVTRARVWVVQLVVAMALLLAAYCIVNLAVERRRIAGKIMPKRDRLGLDAPGVGGQHGVGRLRRQRQDRLARRIQLVEGDQEIVAGDQALGGGADVLPAAPRMQPAAIRSPSTLR